MPKIVTFILSLLFILVFIFVIHILVLKWLKHDIFSNLITQAYIINYLLAVIIYSIIYKLRIKYGHIIGFMFMIGSFLKFIVFFLIFYPVYISDNIMSKYEFTAFFIPYLSCLIFDTVCLIKILNPKKR